MKTMVISDFATMGSSLLQMLGIMATVYVVIGVTIGSISGAAATVTVMSFVYVFSLASSDEMSDWEAYRLTLPLSRRQVVFGRYLSVVLTTVISGVLLVVLGLVTAWIATALDAGAGSQPVISNLTFTNNPPTTVIGAVLVANTIVLAVFAVALPLIMRFGMTRAVRLAPLVAVFVIVVAINFMGSDAAMMETVSGWFAWVGSNDAAAVLMPLGVFIVMLAIFMATAPVAARLYAKRQF